MFFLGKKRLSEQDLIKKVRGVLDKQVAIDAKITHEETNIMLSNLSKAYTYVYLFIVSNAIAKQLGVSSITLALSGRFEDELINDGLRNLNNDTYKKISEKLLDLIKSKEAYYDPLYINTISSEGVRIIIEQSTEESLEKLSEIKSAAEFKKILVVAPHCQSFYAKINKFITQYSLN